MNQKDLMYQIDLRAQQAKVSEAGAAEILRGVVRRFGFKKLTPEEQEVYARLRESDKSQAIAKAAAEVARLEQGIAQVKDLGGTPARGSAAQLKRARAEHKDLLESDPLKDQRY